MFASLYSREQEEEDIFVFLEAAGNSLAQVSLELLSKARELAGPIGWTVTGLFLGERAADVAQEAWAYGADRIIVVEDPALAQFNVEAFTFAAFEAVKEFRPSVLLLGATLIGRDLAGRLAVRLRTGLNADCTGLSLDEESGLLTCEVSGFGGGILALIHMEEHRPQMATIRPGVFVARQTQPRKDGQLLTLSVIIPTEVNRTQILESSVGEALDLSKTSVLLAGGRGIEGDFETLRLLAELLGGDYGATRPPVDDGYVERERQIGQTGAMCRPELALVCGISGAFHFVVGIQDAKTVVAINSDPEAPIFDYADYCLVADAREILPQLLDRLQEQKGENPPVGNIMPEVII